MNTRQLARICSALSNENRLEMLKSILACSRKDFEREQFCLMATIRDNLCIGAPTISHHLKELEDAGLIITEKNGKFLVARGNDAVLNELRDGFGFLWSPDEK